MAGEHVVVSLAVHASGNCPVQQSMVSASYADGGEPPLLRSSEAPDVGKFF